MNELKLIKVSELEIRRYKIKKLLKKIIKKDKKN